MEGTWCVEVEGTWCVEVEGTWCVEVEGTWCVEVEGTWCVEVEGTWCVEVEGTWVEIEGHEDQGQRLLQQSRSGNTMLSQQLHTYAKSAVMYAE